jgi:glycosyltransferase involved in cell wall biosynthesis
MDILYLSGYDFWDFIWFRPQQVTTRLSKTCRILYIEPTRAGKWRKPRNWFRIRHANDNLTVFSPMVLPGISRVPWLRRINQAILGYCIKRLLKKYKFNEFHCMIGTPFMGQFAKKFGEKLTIYDCNDNWTSVPKLPTAFLQSEEDKLLEKSDITFVTSRQLLEDKKMICNNVVLSPSAADIQMYQDAFEDVVECPDDVSEIPHPRVGIVGSFNNTKEDFDLLEHLAREKQGYSLVLVGPVMEDVRLENYPNLKQRAYFLGRKEYRQLPQYINAMDVCIAPYRYNRFTLYVNPTKILEYLACGKPVVSTAIPDAYGFESVISVAETYEQFAGMIDSELQTAVDGTKIEARKEFARRNSWEKLVQDMLHYIKTKSGLRENHTRATYAEGDGGTNIGSASQPEAVNSQLEKVIHQ